MGGIFYNQIIDKKQLKRILLGAFNKFGILKASYLAHQLKDIGFHYATQAGLSVSIEDLRVPPMKKFLMEEANEKVYKAEAKVKSGLITEVERFQNVIYTWSNTSESLKDQLVLYFRTTDPLNSIYMMAFSGARGNLSQVRQLVGMRGLMANPTGQIIDLPITANFREGLKVTDYIISSYGARKGLVDTALRTADSGYLTRRLIDVAQEIITRERNCKTKSGILIYPVQDLEGVTKTPIHERILGRILAAPIYDLATNQMIANIDEEITPSLIKKIQKLSLEQVVVRSPLTCASMRSVCQFCYGWNLAYGRLIDLGEAVGILAAQSIGEPGTQLTMRTFHTGGVFTAELSRQVRAEFSGQVIYSKNLNPKQVRTAYGEIAYVTESESSLRLISYKNFQLTLKILPTNLILVKNKSFVKKNDLLLELSNPSSGSEKAFKNIAFKQSGELIVENQKNQSPIYTFDGNLKRLSTCLIWILSGQVYNVPLNLIISMHTNSKQSLLGFSSLVNRNDGRISIFEKEAKFNIDLNNKESWVVEVLHDQISFQNFNAYIEEEENRQLCSIYGSNNWRIFLNTLTSSTNRQVQENFGNLINLEYRTQTGGLFFPTTFFRERSQISVQQSIYQLKVGGTIFYVPEATFIVPYDEPIFYKTGDQVIFGDEIAAGVFATISGFFEISENKKLFREIRICPGRIVFPNKEKSIRNYHKKVFFPGEQIFENIEIDVLSYSEVKKINGNNLIILYPIIRYEVLSFENTDQTLSFVNVLKSNPNLLFGKLKHNREKKIKSSQPYQFIEQPLLINPNLRKKNLSLKVQFVESYQNRKNTNVNLLTFETISVKNEKPKELKKLNFYTAHHTQSDQYIEPFSYICSFQIVLKEKNDILFLKEQIGSKERRILVNKKTDFQTFYFEDPYINRKSNTFLKIIDKPKASFLYTNAGLIRSQHGNSKLIHLGSPYLIAQGGSIDKYPGDLVTIGENLAQLSYQRAKTGDIVQGLPRIEEILEARKPKTEAFLAIRPGIIMNMSYESSNLTIWLSAKRLVRYVLPKKYRLLVSKFEYIHVGQPLNDTTLNHHNLLDVYFLYYNGRKFLTTYQAAYKSLRKIQSVLIRSTQAIYESQGVTIADKHLEIIIKQMTGKVQVISSEESPLLPEELLDLTQIYYINKALGNRKQAFFKPVLMGITKASLKTNSFISAASFQYTTRILTEAAVQGKIDWLRGLKENVIVGRLIPAGTGFNTYSDISSLIVTVPSSFTKLKQTPQPRIKYASLHNKKFKFLSSR